MTDSNSTENWLPVVGYEGLYDISDLGRVRSLDRVVEQKGKYDNRVLHTYRGKVLRPRIKKRGYLHVCLCRSGLIDQQMIHRLVLSAFVGPCPNDMVCRHFPDRNPANNRLVNLSWGTCVENAADQIQHGTKQFGNHHVSSKITNVDVRRIFKLRSMGLTLKDIGAEVGVCGGQVWRILKGMRWAHTGDYESSRYKPALSSGRECA